MDMNFFKTFLLAAKYGSISIASEEVHLSQPAVTKQIRALEELYAVKLFERSSRLKLTEEGNALLSYANQIVNLFNESLAAVGEIGDHVRGALRFGSNLTIGIYVLPQLLQRFSAMYPDVHVEIVLHNSEHIIRGVRKKEFNFGFISSDTDEVDIIRHLFYKDRVLAVAAKALDLGRTRLAWSELQTMPFVTRERGSDIRETVEQWLKSHKRHLAPTLVLNNTEAIKQCVRCGFGFSFLPSCAVATEIQQGIFDVLDVPDFHPVQEFFVHHYEGRRFSRPERIFLEFLAQSITARNEIESGDIGAMTEMEKLLAGDTVKATCPVSD